MQITTQFQSYFKPKLLDPSGKQLYRQFNSAGVKGIELHRLTQDALVYTRSLPINCPETNAVSVARKLVLGTLVLKTGSSSFTSQENEAFYAYQHPLLSRLKNSVFSKSSPA